MSVPVSAGVSLSSSVSVSVYLCVKHKMPNLNLLGPFSTERGKRDLEK